MRIACARQFKLHDPWVYIILHDPLIRTIIMNVTLKSTGQLFLKHQLDGPWVRTTITMFVRPLGLRYDHNRSRSSVRPQVSPSARPI